VTINSQGIFLTQRKYALEILDECRLLGSKPTGFPMKTNHKLALVNDKSLIEGSNLVRKIGRKVDLPNNYATRIRLCNPYSFAMYASI